MKKVVIIVRTSTVRQEIDSQREEVIKYAMADGYSLDEIEVIGDAGSSAIKLDERYLENINKVYRLIETTPTIECVYAWAIDRIGRKEELLMNFKNFLISKKINLKIKNPSLYLLEADGRVNSGAELAFSLFATMAKQEMEQKKERFKRAKTRNQKEGKFNGGAETRFGYSVENGYFVVNKEESDIVRLIFEEYSTGNYSMQKLCDELNSRGIKNRGKLLNVPFIHKIVTTTDYIGKGNKPVILDSRLFEKCEKIRNKQTSTLLSKESKTVHLATKLLKCKECGTNYSANFDRYVCYKHRFAKRFTDTCSNDLNIRIDILDSLLWEVAYKMHKEYLSIIDEDKVAEVLKEIEVLEQKINEAENKLEKMKVRKQRVKNLYIDGITDDTEFKTSMKKINAESMNNVAELDNYNEQLAKCKDIIYILQHPELQSDIRVENNEDKKAIVNKHIKDVYIERYTFNGSRATKIVINNSIQYLYNSFDRRKTGNNIFYWENEQWVGKCRL